LEQALGGKNEEIALLEEKIKKLKSKQKLK